MERLQREASRVGKPAEVLVSEWLTAWLAPVPPPSERERAREVLRAAGLLSEPTAAMHAIATQSTATLAEIQATFARVGGQPLSEIVIEQRGPKG